jgi:hypothetical protein
VVILLWSVRRCIKIVHCTVQLLLSAAQEDIALNTGQFLNGGGGSTLRHICSVPIVERVREKSIVGVLVSQLSVVYLCTRTVNCALFQGCNKWVRMLFFWSNWSDSRKEDPFPPPFFAAVGTWNWLHHPHLP